MCFITEKLEAKHLKSGKAMPIRTERTVVVVEWTCVRCGRLFEHEGPCIAHERAHAIRRDTGTMTTAQQQPSVPLVDLEEMAEISEMTRDQVSSEPAVVSSKDSKVAQIISTSDSLVKRDRMSRQHCKASIDKTDVEPVTLISSKASIGFKSSVNNRRQARRFTYNGREYK